MSPILGPITLGVYAFLLAAGGVLGFVKAGSRPSLVAGLASAAIAFVCLVIAALGSAFGLWLGAALAFVLLGLFAIRFSKSRKVMPSGVMVVVSLVALVLLVVCAFTERA
jgi:uncharacterized membrane protein (UPF0136 family)